MNDTFDNLLSGCLVLMVVFIVMAVIVFPFVKFSSTGRGTHTGFITAIEQEGYIFRNYRVYVKTDNSSSQEDKYCMDRSKADLAEKLREFSKNRELVSVTFEGTRGIGLGLCDGVQILDVARDAR